MRVGRRELGFASLVLLCAAAVPLAAPGPGLVPAAAGGAPGWLLGAYGNGLGVSNGLYYGMLWAAFAAHLGILLTAPSLPRAAIRGVSILLVAAFVLSPPLLSADVFSYIDYARLGALHGINPYTHAPAALPGDAAFPFVGWTGVRSAYGPLFTLLTYPLGLLTVPAALWALKAASGLAVLGLAWLVAAIAPARGVDPRRSFVLVALNPLVLVHVVGGAHNDALATLLVTAACAAILARREITGGFGLVAAIGLKLSTAFAAPFALLGAASPGRRRSATTGPPEGHTGGAPARLLLGACIGALAIAAAALLAFGPHALDSVRVAGENQGRVSSFSIPNLLAEASNFDVDTVRALAATAYAAAFIYLLGRVWRGADWIWAAGWAAFGLLLASAWLLPWYVLWALPFAALGRDGRLVAAVLTLTALLLAARLPL